MNKDDFKQMLRLMLLSVGLLVLGAIFLTFSNWATWMSWLVMLPGIAPLGWYHFKVLMPKAESGLPQAAIDSVYYFGFLVTVAALCISALMVGLHGAAASIDTIVMQFSAGLVATGYAVAARLHLQSRVSGTSETTLEEVMDKYVHKSIALVENVEQASQRLSEFSQKIVERTIEAAELTRLAANEKMLDVATQFSEQMSEALESARQGVHEFRVVMNSTAFAAERQQYIDSVKESVHAVRALNAGIAELVIKTQEKVKLTQQDITASTNLSGRLNEFALQVKELSGPQGLGASATSLKDSCDSVNAAHATLTEATQTLQQLMETVELSSDTLEQVRKISKRASEQFDKLSDTSERVGNAAAQVESLAESAKNLARHVKTFDAVVETVSGTAEDFAANLEKAQTASSALDARVTQLPAQAEAIETFGARIGRSLEAIADQAEHARNSSETLAHSSASASRALEGAVRLGDSVTTLEGSMVALHKMFSDLGASVTNAQNAMHEASVEARDRLAESAQRLDQDIQRSATSVTVVAERLGEATRALHVLEQASEAGRAATEA
jgi:methyl-accepting chemotaxis protein